MINTINAQKDCVVKTFDTISKVDSILVTTNNQIMGHIEEANKVDKKLGKSIDEILEYVRE